MNDNILTIEEIEGAHKIVSDLKNEIKCIKKRSSKIKV